MGTDIDIIKPKRALAVYEAAWPKSATNALATGSSLRDITRACANDGRVRADNAHLFDQRQALERRDKWLAHFGEADAARGVLGRLLYVQRLERSVIVPMLMTLLSSLGMKSRKGDGLLKGMLDMIESDEIAPATGGGWRLSNDCDAASRWRQRQLGLLAFDRGLER
jgi:hypothetical protein